HCRQWLRSTHYKRGATPYLGRTSTSRIARACGWRTHSITSSASASSVVGTSRSAFWRLLRLIANSRFVGAAAPEGQPPPPLRRCERKILDTTQMGASERFWTLLKCGQHENQRSAILAKSLVHFRGVIRRRS